MIPYNSIDNTWTSRDCEPRPLAVLSTNHLHNIRGWLGRLDSVGLSLAAEAAQISYELIMGDKDWFIPEPVPTAEDIRDDIAEADAAVVMELVKRGALTEAVQAEVDSEPVPNQYIIEG